MQEPGGPNRVRPGTPEGYSGGWIERLDPKTKERRILYDRCGEHRLRGPNDLVFDGLGGFYFTDYGKLWPRHRDNGGLYYALADGSRIVEVAYPMIMPNGVGLSPDGKVVYAAETETGRLWAFDLDAPGIARKYPFPSPHGGRLVCGLPGYQRFDSMALQANGDICVATLRSACISVISPAGEVLRQVPTGDLITTNICFGGADLRTAYITLSGAGKVVAMEWPEPGLALAHG
jgi:gluconolactonase